MPSMHRHVEHDGGNKGYRFVIKSRGVIHETWWRAFPTNCKWRTNYRRKNLVGASQSLDKIIQLSIRSFNCWGIGVKVEEEDKRVYTSVHSLYQGVKVHEHVRDAPRTMRACTRHLWDCKASACNWPWTAPSKKCYHKVDPNSTCV